MLTDLLLPAPTDLSLEEVQASATGLTLILATTAPQVSCPHCQQLTNRRHSYYQRTLADVPWATRAVRVLWHTRRFFCPNPACARRVFTERLPALAAPSARRTQRLTTLLQQLGQALGGEAGARFGQLLGLLTSPTTLIRLVRQAPDPLAPTPRRIGIDDFAFRKGHTYGTILIDHETGQTIDLLADRTQESVATWLRAHPEVTLITRDRAAVYADGATLGAPQATQVADRWHLLHNLSDTLDEILTRLYPDLCQALDAGVADLLAARAPVPAAGDPLAASVGPPEEQGPVAPPPAHARQLELQQQRRAQRQARYDAVCTRHQAGQSISQIARELGLSQRTVERFLRAGSFPERQARSPAASRLDPYKAFLRERWAAGCHNKARLWREVQARGYTGSYASVYAWLSKLDATPADPAGGGVPGHKRAKVGRREWKRRLGRPAGELSQEEAAAVAQVCAQNGVLGRVYGLAQEFGQMVRERQRTKFDGWLQRAIASGVAELARFAGGLQKDYAAVAAALELPFSNGPTEGHVNRLKVVKRTMYGRAKFDLLRKRVLCAI